MSERIRGRTSPKDTGARWRERLAIAHAIVLVVASAWMFGGKIWWAKPILCLLVTPAAVLCVSEFIARGGQAHARRIFWSLLPLGLLALQILASVGSPLLSLRQFGEDTLYALVSVPPWQPGSAHPDATWREAWLQGGLYLVGFNLFICVRSRRALRVLMAVLAVNAVVLSIFGTLQYLLGRDIFFGLERAPHPAFFATFVYHNHWGPFVLLSLTLSLGLIYHYGADFRPHRERHSPIPAGIVACLFMAGTVPLSSSRSGTLLIAVLLLVAYLHAAFRLLRRFRSAESERRQGAGVLAAMALAVLGSGWAIYQLGEKTIDRRIANTREQVAEMLTKGDVGQRRVLYRDTWAMARERIWFGWGLESYERVFPRFNTAAVSRVDGLPVAYQEAHHDWLQAVAELGLVGVALLLALVALPLILRPAPLFAYPISGYGMFGCVLVALYAGVEFPFANPTVFGLWWIVFFLSLRYALLSTPRESTAKSAGG